MSAKSREKQIQIYGMDLLWLIAKRYYDGLTQPSDLYKEQKEQKQTAKQIKEYILARLGGE
jgi:hypothetical protein